MYAARAVALAVVALVVLATPAHAASGDRGEGGPPLMMLVGAGIALLFLTGVAVALRRRNAREDAERARTGRDGP